MRFYLASKYSNKEKMREVRKKLVAVGHIVTSRWLDESYSPHVQITDVTPEELAGFAGRDARDIIGSDAVVHFQDGPNDRGGAIAEFGMSLGLRMGGTDQFTILVGEQRHVFDFHYMVDHFPTEEEFLAWAQEVKDYE